IRLLRVLPSESQDAPISCDLLQMPLSTVKRVYDALSYVWADSTSLSSSANSVCCISVYGFKLTVTPNLYAALVRLRCKDQNRLIWIDQICINQADIQERNTQVERMTLIYGFASKTVVWLGEELEES
ncbi:HET-domain-containing protein, partial [Glonium stellatum]